MWNKNSSIPAIILKTGIHVNRILRSMKYTLFVSCSSYVCISIWLLTLLWILRMKKRGVACSLPFSATIKELSLKLLRHLFTTVTYYIICQFIFKRNSWRQGDKYLKYSQNLSILYYTVYSHQGTSIIELLKGCGLHVNINDISN